jgi:cephalosporin-C deacetylase
MPANDMAITELTSYDPESNAPADLDLFWEQTLALGSSSPLEIELTPAGIGLRGVSCHRFGFAGFGAERISGWYVRPEGGGPFPGLVWYHGYSGRGARPLELYTAAAQGIAVLSMDCRGQGGESPDAPGGPVGHAPGWLTMGIRGPEGYYYRYVYADAVRAIEALCSLEEVDGARIAVTGASQGGGLALAAAALSKRPIFVWADMPFLCHFRRAVEIAVQGPYPEISDFVRRHPGLEEDSFRTLSYFDNLNLASRIGCPAVVTAGLWDDVCPPSTIFPTFARIGATDKVLETFSFQRHELAYEIEESRLAALIVRLRPGSSSG